MECGALQLREVVGVSCGGGGGGVLRSNSPDALFGRLASRGKKPGCTSHLWGVPSGRELECDC